ncbi:MAG: aminodeoxychorismate/anthranilate synthase component II [Rhodobacteraceae bacterium]|nr:aminodeoxychorismate/anthranilate synthase component II [Paracoccaceae bacterium]
MILLIDNYDSFTFNLVQYLGELGSKVTVYRNDKISCDEALGMQPVAIVLSPGPCDPDKAGICLQLVAAAAAKRIPLLGICLGHQAVAQAFGAKIIQCHEIVHGKTDDILHEGAVPLAGLPSPFTATRYHSLTVDRDTLPTGLEVTASTADGVVMGLKHRQLPIFGLQFHPESIATQFGHRMLRQFLEFQAG